MLCRRSLASEIVVFIFVRAGGGKRPPIGQCSLNQVGWAFEPQQEYLPRPRTLNLQIRGRKVADGRLRSRAVDQVRCESSGVGPVAFLRCWTSDEPAIMQHQSFAERLRSRAAGLYESRCWWEGSLDLFCVPHQKVS